jgi:hypothetical protein
VSDADDERDSDDDGDADNEADADGDDDGDAETDVVANGPSPKSPSIITLLTWSTSKG